MAKGRQKKGKSEGGTKATKDAKKPSKQRH